MMAKFRLLGMNCSVEGPLEALLLAPFLREKKRTRPLAIEAVSAVTNST
jgi:hypothetical protein